MAQRLAVLLAVASILIVACAAEYSGQASAYKYEKKAHVRTQPAQSESLASRTANFIPV
jgi:outer membrane biogenesis lipoprotein LolB